MAASALTGAFQSAFAYFVPQGGPDTSVVGVKAGDVAKSNGDFVLTPQREFVYCGIDFVGGARQISAAMQAGSILAHGSTPLAAVAGAIVPFGLLITGPMGMFASAKWIIPDGHNDLKAANQELLDAGADSEKISEAKHAITMARLGLANLYSLFAMSAVQTAAGIGIVLSSETAKVLHYAPLLTGSAATITNGVLGGLLGGVYVVRGAVMLGRTIKGYGHVRKFKKGYKDSLQSLDKAVGFAKEQMQKGDAYIGRRIDLSCLNKGDLDSTLNNQSDKIDFLKRVDKALYTQILKHRVGIIVASAMILGGITAIALTILTGGIAPIIIGLASAIFFMSMEYIFLTYDSSKVFEKLRDYLYKPSAELLALEANSSQ